MVVTCKRLSDGGFSKGLFLFFSFLAAEHYHVAILAPSTTGAGIIEVAKGNRGAGNRELNGYL